MAALTLRVIWKNPLVTLNEICKIFPKFEKHLILGKGKYLANSYTAARVNVYYKLSSFFPMLF